MVNPKTILYILFGILVGAVLFFIGDADDAPGLSLIGLSAAFLLIMRGVYNANLLRKGYYLPCILLVFGMVGLLLPIVLYFDQEINFNAALIGSGVGLVLVLFAFLRIITLRRKK